MLRSIIFWVCLPFVVVQALRVRNAAPRFAGASGPSNGGVGAGPEFNLVAVGDSIIAGVGATTFANALVGQTAEHLASALDCRINWAAFGIIGARSEDLLDQLIPELPKIDADFIVVSVGVNEVTGLSRVATWARNLDAILKALRQHSPSAIVAVAGIPPMKDFPLLPQPLRALLGIRAETMDITCRRVIARYPLAVHVPLRFDPQPDRFSADGFHPSEAGYRVFGEAVASLLAEKVKEIEASDA